MKGEEGDQPLFTIVTPTLNIGKYLHKNINSVKSQTFHDFEHLFIDGYSSDNTITIIEDYKKRNENVRLVQTEAKGISNAFNVGIENAKGKFIIFLNGDDFFCSNDSLKKAANILLKNPHINWLQGKAAFNVENKTYTISSFLNRVFYYFLLSFGCPVSHPSTIITKSLLQDIKGFDESLKYQMDTDIFHKLKGKETVYFTNFPISALKLRRGSTTLKNYFDRIKYWKLFYKRYSSIVFVSGIIWSIKYFNRVKQISS